MGPGAKNVAGAKAFSLWSGSRVERLVDFLPDTTWESMTYIDWALKPYTGTGYQLELSVPMLPSRVPGVSLAACAAGKYDKHWTAIGRRLVDHRLPATHIRPGWEMNGNWYRWSAAGNPAAYGGLDDQVVGAVGRQHLDHQPRRSGEPDLVVGVIEHHHVRHELAVFERRWLPPPPADDVQPFGHLVLQGAATSLAQTSWWRRLGAGTITSAPSVYSPRTSAASAS